MNLIILLLFGICLVALGILNIKGNITSVHWYNRLYVTKENMKIYGKLMGVGTIVIGIGMLVTSLLQMIYDLENLWFIILICLVIGVILICYAQFKYNKGIIDEIKNVFKKSKKKK